MSWTTGERADAHHLVGVLREKFARDEKRSSREFVADYFRSAQVSSVLDLWGGGQSARALRDALPDARIVSVENGSVCDTDWFRDRNGRRVSKERLRRAHAIDCDEAGVEALWGDASAAIAGMSAVWLDFCSQWHPKMAKLIDLAGPHVDHLAVTVQPDRDGFGNLGLHDRLLAVASVIAGHADMVPAYVGSYQRNDQGQDMALFVMDRRSTSGDGREAAIVLPRHILSGLNKCGAWSSRRLSRMGALRMAKCTSCSASFTFRTREDGFGPRTKCDKCRTYTPKNVGKPCARCGGPISGLKRQRFCSDECQRPPQAKPPCYICGGVVPKGRVSLCSDECRKERAHRKDAKRYWSSRTVSIVPCAYCGNAFERTHHGPRRFCSTGCRKSSERTREYRDHQAAILRVTRAA